MSEIDLQEMVAAGSHFAEEAFKQTGGVPQVWMIVTKDDECMFLPQPPDTDKDTVVRVVRAVLKKVQATRYIFISEGWSLQKTGSIEELDRIRRERPSIADHPDRVEIVQFQGEDHDCGQIIAQRRIIRDDKPHLGELEIVVKPGDHMQSEGRMVGLLPQRGSTH